MISLVPLQSFLKALFVFLFSRRNQIKNLKFFFYLLGPNTHTSMRLYFNLIHVTGNDKNFSYITDNQRKQNSPKITILIKSLLLIVTNTAYRQQWRNLPREARQSCFQERKQNIAAPHPLWSLLKVLGETHWWAYNDLYMDHKFSRLRVLGVI